MNQIAERMISNKSPAKMTHIIKGIGLKGFLVRESFGFAIIRDTETGLRSAIAYK
jgi:hypothetical protein